MKYLYKLLRLFLCPHYWYVREQINMHIVDWNDEPITNYTKYILQCRRCGDIKKKESK